MVNKIDFTNVLGLEIDRLKDIINILKEEIKVREHDYSFNANPEYKGNTRLEEIHNRKAIHQLKAELRSKEDFLQKLEEKSLVDTSELEADFEKMEAEISLDIEKAAKIVSDPEASGSLKARIKYTLEEYGNWINEPAENGSRKEASVYYWKCLRSEIESAE